MRPPDDNSFTAAAAGAFNRRPVSFPRSNRKPATSRQIALSVPANDGHAHQLVVLEQNGNGLIRRLVRVVPRFLQLHLSVVRVRERA